MRVERTAEGWEVFGGTYTAALGWGDVVRASLASGSCEAGSDAPSDNSSCHLAELGSSTDYDTHAIGGFASVTVTDPEPVCP